MSYAEANILYADVSKSNADVVIPYDNVCMPHADVVKPYDDVSITYTDVVKPYDDVIYCKDLLNLKDLANFISFNSIIKTSVKRSISNKL